MGARHSAPFRRLLTGMVTAASLQGCGLAGSTLHEDLQRELNRNRRLWETHQPAEYLYVGRRSCFCGDEVVQPVVVEVRGDEVVSQFYRESGEPVAATFAGLWPSIDGVFDIVQDAIDQEAAELSVEYDPDYGYPRSVVIDYSEQVADEELTYTASDLEVVE